MANQFDSANYPEPEPERLIIGDRWLWKRTDLGADYAPASYSLKYSLRLEGSQVEIEITANESGNDYLVEVAASTTVNYNAGTYNWQAYITRTSDSERITVDRGTTVVATNKDAADIDSRSHVKKVLDALEATLEAKATKDQLSYSIQGRAVSRLSPEELVSWRNKYRQYYRDELAAVPGKSSGRRVRVRFQ